MDAALISEQATGIDLNRDKESEMAQSGESYQRFTGVASNSRAGKRTLAGEWQTSPGDISGSFEITPRAARILESKTRTVSEVIALHDQRTELHYPESCQKYIDLLFVAQTRSFTRSADRAITVRETGPDRYVIGGDIKGRNGDELNAEELLDALLEEITHSLIYNLETALALHASSVSWRGKSVLIAGPTSTGKTSLAGWLIARNFLFLSDELVVLPQNRTTALSFPRPLLVKSAGEELIAILARAGHSRTVQTAAHTIICLNQSSCDENAECEAGLIIFPHFVAGAGLELASMSPGMTCLKLMECNLNARNLDDHGLRTLAAFARRIPALSLTYGSYQQLGGVVDTLAKFVLESDATVADLQKLTSAFRSHSPAIRTWRADPI